MNPSKNHPFSASTCSFSQKNQKTKSAELQPKSATVKIVQPKNVVKAGLNEEEAKQKQQPAVINVAFQPNIEVLQSLTENSFLATKDLREKNFSSFVIIDGNDAKNFFTVGFLLIQEVLFQDLLLIRNGKVTNSMVPTFPALLDLLKPKPHNKSLLNLQQQVKKSSKDFDLNDRQTIADLICEQCSTDKGLAHAIDRVGRNLIIKYIMSKTIDHTKYNTMDQFAKDIESAIEHSENILNDFCWSSTFKLVLYSMKDGKLITNVIGISDATSVAYIFDYPSQTNGFRVILYQDKDQHPKNLGVQMSGEKSRKNMNNQRIDSHEQIKDSAHSTASNVSPLKPDNRSHLVLTSIVDENKKFVKVKALINDQTQSEEHKLQQQSSKLSAALSPEMECSICLDHIYQCVTVMPCLHNFCGACFSDYMQKFKVCPTCQEDMYSVKKNAIMNNIIQKFLEENPEKKRSKEEYESMDAKDRIKQEMIKF